MWVLKKRNTKSQILTLDTEAVLANGVWRRLCGFKKHLATMDRQSRLLLTEPRGVGQERSRDIQVCKANLIIWWTILRLIPVCNRFPLPIFVLSPLV